MRPPRSLTALSLLACLLGGCTTLGATSEPRAITNSLGMEFVQLPAGEFLMGSDETPERLAHDYPQYERRRLTALGDEAPVHRVRITQPFFMGRHEVTVGQFRQFVEASGYTPESLADGTGGYGYNAAYDPATTQRGDAF